MPHFSENAEEFLSELESFLAQEPSHVSQHLAEVPTLLEGFEENGEVAAVEQATQLLGTAVGAQKAWQHPYQESGILAHVLQRLSPSTSPVGLSKQFLRVIGNSVADNDVNRTHVLPSFETLIRCLHQDELTVMALAVMLNLCNDYEPAQCEAAKLRLDNTISEYLASDKLPDAALDYAVDLLSWTTDKLTSTQLKDDVSLRTFDNILQVVQMYDEDHYNDYVAVLALYLQDPEFHQKLATPERFESLADLMYAYESRLEPDEIQDVFRGLTALNDPEKFPTDETSVVLMVQLINSLGAISASDTFVQNFNIRSPVVKKIRSKFLSSASSPSTVCACVILGNLATSDEVCINMVEDLDMHINLVSLLSSRSESALLYAAAGFMRHLVFPEENRKTLGETGLIETCCHLLAKKDPAVRGEAAAVLGKVISNNFPNIEKVIYESVPEGITLAQITGVEVPVHPTILYHIITQALVPAEPLPSTSMKNPMIEIGRTVIAILRYLGRPNAEVDIESVARHMFKTPLVARPVARLVRQRFYADARSEGLLGLGLLAQSPEGATAVVEEIKADEALLEAIKEFAVEQNKEGQAASRDYQNTVVLLHGLMANGVNAMDPSLKDGIDALSTELSKLIV